jgi:hypothetical protein
MIIGGIDPGSRGCIALLDTETKICTYLKIPYRSDRTVDAKVIYAFLPIDECEEIYFEEVHGRGGTWGAKQNHTFGFNVGAILQTLTDYQTLTEHYSYEIFFVKPKEWQAYAHRGITGDNPKQKSKLGFDKINPAAKIKHDGVIDAFHIARYGVINAYSSNDPVTNNYTFIDASK